MFGGDTARGGKDTDSAAGKEYERALAAATGAKAGSPDFQRFAAEVIMSIFRVCLHLSHSTSGSLSFSENSLPS